MIIAIVGGVLAVLGLVVGFGGLYMLGLAAQKLDQATAMLREASAEHAETQDLWRQVDEATARLIRESGGGHG
jgi:hypothetical protein